MYEKGKFNAFFITFIPYFRTNIFFLVKLGTKGNTKYFVLMLILARIIVGN